MVLPLHISANGRVYTVSSSYIPAGWFYYPDIDFLNVYVENWVCLKFNVDHYLRKIAYDMRAGSYWFIFFLLLTTNHQRIFLFICFTVFYFRVVGVNIWNSSFVTAVEISVVNFSDATCDYLKILWPVDLPTRLFYLFSHTRTNTLNTNNNNPENQGDRVLVADPALLLGLYVCVVVVLLFLGARPQVFPVPDVSFPHEQKTLVDPQIKLSNSIYWAVADRLEYLVNRASHLG